MSIEDFLPLSAPMYAVLITIGDGAMHGFGIIRSFEATTGHRGALLPGSLYNTIARMLKYELLDEVAPPPEESDGRKRYYRATELGRSVAAAESARLRALLALADQGGLAPTGPA